jgi:cyclopropane fatty-acyl-phospholipid synthase-like methyltransferase
MERNNEQSVRFDLVYSKPEMAFGIEPEPELAKFIESSEHKGKALDLGCGDGRHALFLAKNGYNVTGVDISAVAIKKLKSIAKKEKLDSMLELHHSDARDFNYPTEEFDLVVSVTLFDHVPKKDVRPLFEKVAGSLKTEGVIFIKVHTVKDPGKLNGSDRASELSWAIQHYFKAEELRSLLETEFKILKYSEYDDFDRSHGKPHYHNFAIALALKTF